MICLNKRTIVFNLSKYHVKMRLLESWRADRENHAYSLVSGLNIIQPKRYVFFNLRIFCIIISERIECIGLENMEPTKFEECALHLLDRLRESSIIHCDISSSNLLLSKNGDLYVIDWEWMIEYDIDYTVNHELTKYYQNIGGRYRADPHTIDDATSFQKIHKELFGRKSKAIEEYIGRLYIKIV